MRDNSFVEFHITRTRAFIILTLMYNGDIEYFLPKSIMLAIIRINFVRSILVIILNKKLFIDFLCY